MTISITEGLRVKLEKSLNEVVFGLGDIQIGNPNQFPYGWRKSAKGRTVWRILEEAIAQNLEFKMSKLGFEFIKPAESEVGVYDFVGKLVGDDHQFYVNIKSSVIGARTNKDDISKARKLIEFFSEDISRNLFIATFFIDFNKDMSVTVSKASVFPVSWIPDIYVNPSNNGNLQSSKYKDISTAVKRSNKEFFDALSESINIADIKKSGK